MQSGVSRSYMAMLACFAAVLLACPGCGGSSNAPAVNPDDNNPGPAGAKSHNVLQLHMPPVAGMAAGAEFEYTISAAFSDTLYQGCGRVVYDASVLQPIEVARGAAIPAEYVFATKLDAPPMLGTAGASQAFVPFAFTGLPGGTEPAGVKGELLKLRFRLLQAAPASCNVGLLNDAQFLQMRSPKATRLPFDLQVEVTGK
jgi:hypothetical protein